MNCPACNHNVNPAAKFCTQCGQPLTDAVPVAAAAPPVTATLKAHTSGYIQSVRDAIIRQVHFNTCQKADSTSLSSISYYSACSYPWP
ncbi:zinc ribbon domain-containing protein [Geomicrobium sp. JCM 19039]|uniref:double zinc ribbon domain-containing protein n=1 Tax=Geomicrobium sp. JCM 19039 TaxID=1460636 RepID=UPI0035A66887